MSGEYSREFQARAAAELPSLPARSAVAGAGRSKIRTAWTDADEEDIQLIDDEFMRSEEEFIEGSPRRALGLENPFSQYYFFDADAGRAALLKGLQSDFPERKINVQVGDANGLIQKLVPRLSGRNTKGVAFLDPYGPHLDWQTVATLGATKNFEVIINFPLGMAINRLITRSGDIPDNWRNGLNGCFGSTNWENLVYADQTDLFGDTTRHKVDDAAQRLLDYYVGRLKHLFGHAASPSVVRNTRGVPIYYMLWAGPHPLGYKIADYILSKGDRISPPKKRSGR
ncbi:MAG: three-Cys-motif partner protein TcmP [Rhizobiales bacterium]|nr:three-Cys-motif partner protein TcmP [Hyphomicrobiales bacterium]